MKRLFPPLLGAVLTLMLSQNTGAAQSQTLLYDHVHLAVPDPTAAVSWYLDHFNGEAIEGQQDRVLIGTTQFVFFRSDDAEPSAGSAVDHLGFSVQDLDAKLRELESAGATITSPRRDVSGLFPLAFLDDPWGIRLEVIQDHQHLGFHHIHLRSPDPATTLTWYQNQFGGVRMPLRGRLDGLLYPGNVWLLVQNGDATPSLGNAIDHTSWRVMDLDEKLVELRRSGATLSGEPRTVSRPDGDLEIVFVDGPAGARIELVQRGP
ncbi:MAG: VOC family protein [Gemmatimonadota bacterium]